MQFCLEILLESYFLPESVSVLAIQLTPRSQWPVAYHTDIHFLFVLYVQHNPMRDSTPHNHSELQSEGGSAPCDAMQLWIKYSRLFALTGYKAQI